MTAKRYFVTCEVGDCICELISRKLSDDEFEHLTYQNITDKLNQLIEENEQLRKEKKCDKKVFTKKQLHEWLQQTREENEQLKQEMGDLGTAHAEEINKIEDEFDEEILKLKKENKQLRELLEAGLEVSQIEIDEELERMNNRS